MEKSLTAHRGLSANALKLIAAATMLVDHLGAWEFTDIAILRIIGRISFPIFAYFIYEGCRRTSNKAAYLARVFTLGVICVLVYYMVAREVYWNILITFSLSMCIIFSLQYARVHKRGVLLAAVTLAVFVVCQFIPVDYGFAGVIVPVIAELCSYAESGKSVTRPLYLRPHFIGFAAGLVILAATLGDIQIYSLAALILLAAYNGEKGIHLGKYFFYVYYPLQFLVVGLVSVLVYGNL